MKRFMVVEIFSSISHTQPSPERRWTNKFTERKTEFPALIIDFDYEDEDDDDDDCR